MLCAVAMQRRKRKQCCWVKWCSEQNPSVLIVGVTGLKSCEATGEAMRACGMGLGGNIVGG